MDYSDETRITWYATYFVRNLTFRTCIPPPRIQVTEYMNAGARQWCFLVKGLREVEATLKEMGIPFFLLCGEDVVLLG